MIPFYEPVPIIIPEIREIVRLEFDTIGVWEVVEVSNPKDTTPKCKVRRPDQPDSPISQITCKRITAVVDRIIP